MCLWTTQQDPVFDAIDGNEVDAAATDDLASVEVMEVMEMQVADAIPMEELEALAVGEVVPLKQEDLDALAEVDLEPEPTESIAAEVTEALILVTDALDSGSYALFEGGLWSVDVLCVG